MFHEPRTFERARECLQGLRCVRACVHEELGGGLVHLFNSSKCPSTLSCLSAVALLVYILRQQQLAKDSSAPRLLGWGRPRPAFHSGEPVGGQLVAEESRNQAGLEACGAANLAALSARVRRVPTFSAAPSTSLVLTQH